jgi:hypothetical protein
MQATTVLNELVTQYNNRSISYRGAYPNECIAPVCHYVERLTSLTDLPEMNGAQADGWGVAFPEALAPYFKHQAYQPGVSYPAGTLLIWNTPHIAIVIESDGSDTVTVFEQNADPDGSACGIKQRPVNTDYYSCTFALIPISEPTPPPPMPEIVYVENTVDGIDYRRLKVAPKRMYVRKPEGAQLMDFSGNVETFRDFIGVPNSFKKYGEEVRIMGTAHYPINSLSQDFYITLDDWGNFTSTGHVARLQGYPLSDLNEEPMKPLKPVVEPASMPVVDIAPPIAKMPVDTTRFRFQWFNDDHTPVKFRVMHRITAIDYSDTDDPAVLPKGINVDLYGTFVYKSKILLLLNRSGEQLFTHWYGIPEVVTLNNILYRIVEEIPDYSELKRVTTTVEERIATHTASPKDKLIGLIADHWVDKTTRLEVAAVTGILAIKDKVKGKK